MSLKVTPSGDFISRLETLTSETSFMLCCKSRLLWLIAAFYQEFSFSLFRWACCKFLSHLATPQGYTLKGRPEDSGGAFWKSSMHAHNACWLLHLSDEGAINFWEKIALHLHSPQLKLLFSLPSAQRCNIPFCRAMPSNYFNENNMYIYDQKPQ